MKMKELFDRGEFVVSAEVGPPKGIHVDELVEEAKTYLKDVHAVNVTDNQSSVMRLGSLAMCKVLKDAGMNPIFQLACRDRNRIALESDLLSAAMLGIDNILCLTGDHTKMGDHPQAKPVFDLDSVSLLHTVKLLESGVDLGGNELVGEPPKFSKGAVVSPCSDSVDAQLAKMERKVAAGAEYFQTQAVFEPEKFIKFMEKAKQFGKPVQVGIIIPKSAGMAKFMNNNVAGIHVPDEMLEELKADKEKTKQWSSYFKEMGFFVVSLDARTKNSMKSITDIVMEACKEKIERDRKRGIKNRPVRAMVVGIPNVGKSTFINSYAGKACAKTGNKPGVTKGKQWIRLSKSVELLDTPGILWPKFEDQSVGLKLALIGSIKDEILNVDELAVELIKFLISSYPGLLSERYDVNESGDITDIIIEIAKNRKCVSKGAEVDYSKAAALVIDDFRSGKLGKITLEIPNSQE